MSRGLYIGKNWSQSLPLHSMSRCYKREGGHDDLSLGTCRPKSDFETQRRITYRNDMFHFKPFDSGASRTLVPADHD